MRRHRTYPASRVVEEFKGGASTVELTCRAYQQRLAWVVGEDGQRAKARIEAILRAALRRQDRARV